MDSVTALTSGARPATHARRLSPRAALYLQASLITSFLAGSSAPTPLYPIYQAAWGFSPITATVVFGVYAIAVLVTLLTAGSLSDYVGRRPVLLVTIVLQALTMILYLAAHGVPGLLLARVVQGLATGAAASAVGAGMLDVNKARGAVANAVTPFVGTATGAVVSGLFVQYLPAPTRLIYAVLLVVLVAQGIGVVFMRESSPPRPGALASLRPQLRVPSAVRAPMLAATPALVAAWAFVGLYGRSRRRSCASFSDRARLRWAARLSAPSRRTGRWRSSCSTRARRERSSSSGPASLRSGQRSSWLPSALRRRRSSSPGAPSRA
jgi:MFS family permease